MIIFILTLQLIVLVLAWLTVRTGTDNQTKIAHEQERLLRKLDFGTQRAKFTLTEFDLKFIRDVFEIAKYLNWQSDPGKELAQEIIDKIHAGRYCSSGGIWVQFENVLEKIEKGES